MVDAPYEISERAKRHRAPERLIEMTPVFRRYAAVEGSGRRYLLTRILPPVTLTGAPPDTPLTEAANEHASLRMRAGHPTFLNIHSVRPQDDGSVDMVESMPTGVPLRRLVERAGGLRVDYVAGIVWQLAHALERLHAEGGLHLGLTPDRIVVGPNGALCLIDVGLASIFRRVVPGFKFPDSRWEHLHPEPAFVAHELVGPEAPTPMADVYALAAVAFYGLSGAAPFVGANAFDIYSASRKGQVRSIRRLRSELSPALEEAFGVAFAPFVDNRPQSPTALAEKLFGAEAQIDALDSTWKHYESYLHDRSYDSFLPTVREPTRAAGASVTGSPAEALVVATQTLDAMRATRPAPKERSKRPTLLILVLMLLGGLALLYALQARAEPALPAIGDLSAVESEP